MNNAMQEEKVEKKTEVLPKKNVSELGQDSLSTESIGKDEKKTTSESDNLKNGKILNKDKEITSGEAKDVITEVVAKKRKKRMRRHVSKGKVFIQCTYNNTIITFTDTGGQVLAWSSAGVLGFKGAKKATPYAATQIVNFASEKVSKLGLKEIEVYVKGVGSGREAAIRALVNNDFDITLIKDITPIPHNGCRPRKPRRV